MGYDEDIQDNTNAQDALSDVLPENSKDDDDDVSKECEDDELHFYEQLEEIKCHHETARVPITVLSEPIVLFCWIIIIQFD